MPLRVVFMGTPEFAVPPLLALAEHGHAIVAVYSQPPRPAGRGMALRQSPVHAQAQAMGVDVRTPASLKSPEEQQALAALEADVAVVVAYGLILPQAILDAPRLGCFNIHASLLPRWRGAAPIHRAIMAGDQRTGVTIMKMDAGLDTGPMAMMEHIDIGVDETTGQLHDRLSTLGADLIVRTLKALEMAELERETLALTPQPGDGVTYAAKIDKAEARIDWRLPAKQLHDAIRGLSPFPGAWCEIDIGGKQERVKILGSTLADGYGLPGTVLDEQMTIACGDWAVRLTRLQRAGKGVQDVSDFQRGARVVPGSVLA